MPTKDDYVEALRRRAPVLKDCYILVPHQLPPFVRWADYDPPEKDGDIEDRFVRGDHDAHSVVNVIDGLFGYRNRHQWPAVYVLAFATCSEWMRSWGMEETLCKVFLGARLDDPVFKELSDDLRWDNVWPVINADMRLTGDLSDCAEDERLYGCDAVISVDDAREAGWEIDETHATPPAAAVKGG